MPQRAPASIDMLHSVRRPSIDSARIALPANSMAWPCAPSARDPRDDSERDVLAGDAGAAVPSTVMRMRFRLLLPNRLRHQHMRHFRRADAERVGAERAVRRCVAVAADDQQAWQSEALFGPDDVYDALARIAQSEQSDVVVRGVFLEIAHHCCDLGIGNLTVAAPCRHVMVGDAESEPGLRHRAAACLHLAEGVKRAFVHVVPVDPEQRGAVLAAHDLVRRPQFVEQGLRFIHARASGTGLVAGRQYCMLKDTK